MNCNCISETEKMMSESFKTIAGDDSRATCLATSIGLADTSAYTALSIPFRIRGSKKGYTREKGKEVSFFASYCPFCGKSAKPEAAPNLGSKDSEPQAT